VKKKRNRLQPDALWAAAATLLLLLQFWWLPGAPGSAQDSFSSNVDGKLGLYRTLAQLFPKVEREQQTPVPASNCTLLIIGPDRLPTVAEQKQLADFVQQGGTLLFAPSFAEPNVNLTHLNIQLAELTPPDPLSLLSTPPNPAPPQNQSAPGTPPEPSIADFVGPREVLCHSPLINDSVKLATASRISSGNTNQEVLASNGSDPMAVVSEFGAGRIIVCSTPEFFANRTLLFPNGSRLAVRLAAHGALKPTLSQVTFVPFETDRIVISEYFNNSDSMQGVGVLFSSGLRVGILQLILVAVLSIWLAFHRFGPAQQELQHQRRSLTETARAVGNLQYRISDGGSLVASRVDYLRGQLRRRFGSAVSLENAHSLARLSGLPEKEILAQLELARLQIQQPRLPLSEAAATVRWLSQLQMALLGHIPNRKPQQNSPRDKPR
jgi:hypothetical protein